MIVMTLPIVMPIIKGAAYDPIWFGVFLVLVVEMAQVTPPVGFNLFVIQGLTDESLGYIAKVTLPYLVILIAFTIFLTLYPVWCCGCHVCSRGRSPNPVEVRPNVSCLSEWDGPAVLSGAKLALSRTGRHQRSRSSR
jgi:hypothetical protein